MGSCCTTQNVDFIDDRLILDTMEENRFIVDAYMNNLERYNELKLSMIIPSEVYEFIKAFCGSEAILIKPPIVTVTYVSYDCMTLMIECATNIVSIGHTIRYAKFESGDNMEENRMKWNFIDNYDKSGCIRQEIQELTPNTNYKLLISSRNQYNIRGLPAELFAFTTDA